MTRKVYLKDGTVLGGGERVLVQSMTNIETKKVEMVVEQIKSLEKAGCDIIRCSVKDDGDALALKKIKDSISIPLVADIHFDYRLAIKAIENGVDKIRINPGNIGSEKYVKKVADALKQNKVGVRVGSNTGSIEKGFLDRYGKNEISLGESALKNARILEDNGISDIVLSVKASSVPLTIKAYEYVASKCDYPLHLGVTEAGTTSMGIVKSSIGIGSLLSRGIGDTIRVSLTANPIEEVYAGLNILKAVGLKKDYVEIISCPTCGRTGYDSIGLAERVEKRTANVKKSLRVAVMGCIVNGPGEAKDCDLGCAGGGNAGIIFKKGEIIKRVPLENLEEEFLLEIEKLL